MGAAARLTMRNARIPIPLAVAVLLLVVIAWPSPYAKVRNLDSRGANIIAFGDSLTAGYGANRGEDYPSRLSALIGEPVLNAGVGGDTTAAALARVDGDVLAREPRIVIVELGGNDLFHGIPIATTEANLREIVRKIQSGGAMVVLLGFRFPSLTADYEEMYGRVAKDEGCLLVPRILRGILTEPSLMSDAIHPNARGYQLMAERVASPCKKLIAKANRGRLR
jgi:lysophospholipase L1-like esterase